MESFINEAIKWVTENWEAIIGIAAAVYAVWVKVRNLYYKLKFGSVKNMYQQVQTFKNDTEELVNTLKETQAHLQTVAKLTYELGINANIVKESKLKMQSIIATVTDDYEAIPEDVVIETPEITQEIESNNGNISDILAKL